MEWLTHNPVADMYGPAFLIFYGVVIALTLVACGIARGALDWTGSMPLPAVPASPDPHEIAYLRGGENEVTRSVVFALVQKGLLAVEQQGDDFLIRQAAAPQERRTLSPIERRALDWFGKVPEKTSEMFRESGLPSELKPFCNTYEHNLQRDRLLTSDDVRRRMSLLALACTLFVVGLGAYKMLIAFTRGRFNVIFLVLMAAAAVFVLFKLRRMPRLSRRGQAYLERLQLAFERLRSSKPPAPVSSNAVVEGGNGVPATAYGFDPSLLMLVGVFGVGALADTQYSSFQQSFRRSVVANPGGGSCGSSCGSFVSTPASTSDGSSGSWSDSSSGGSSCASGSSGGSSCGSSCGSGCGGGCGGCGS